MARVIVSLALHECGACSRSPLPPSIPDPPVVCVVGLLKCGQSRFCWSSAVITSTLYSQPACHTYSWWIMNGIASLLCQSEAL